MTPKSIRRIWFLGLWLMVPWPLSVFNNGFVPAVRYAILATAASLIAVTEGGSGPVGLIVVLFVGMTLVTTLACFVLAWIIARALTLLPPPIQSRVTWGVLGAALVYVLLFAPYVTPFGRAVRGGLLAVLS